MAGSYYNYHVTLIRKGSSSKFTTSESGYSNEEIRKKIEKRFPGCTIISIKK